jgi:hypothetical protein
VSPRPPRLDSNSHRKSYRRSTSQAPMRGRCWSTRRATPDRPGPPQPPDGNRPGREGSSHAGLLSDPLRGRHSGRRTVRRDPQRVVLNLTEQDDLAPVAAGPDVRGNTVSEGKPLADLPRARRACPVAGSARFAVTGQEVAQLIRAGTRVREDRPGRRAARRAGRYRVAQLLDVLLDDDTLVARPARPGACGVQRGATRSARGQGGEDTYLGTRVLDHRAQIR